MRPYLAQFSLQARQQLQYRAAALGGAVTQAFFGWVRCAMMTAFYAASAAPQPLTLAQAIDYVWLTQGLLLLVPFRLEYDLLASIHSGAIADELLKPVDPAWMWYARAIARRLVPVALRAAPLIAFALLVGGLHHPPSAAAGAAFIAACCGGVLLSAALSLLLSLSAFWTLGGDGLARLAPMIMWVASGVVLPLPLMPDALQPLIAALPFRGLVDTPARLWSGDLPASDCLPLLLHQALWTAAILALVRMILARGLRRLTIAGG
jgi:ABC-2 type transport system permease protein